MWKKHSLCWNSINDFICVHLSGISHIDRDGVINNHTPTFAKVLFGESRSAVAIAVADGKNIYIEKSGTIHFKDDLTQFIKASNVKAYDACHH